MCNLTYVITRCWRMAPRRRSTRKAAATTTAREPSQQPSETSVLSDVPQINDKDSCPFCSRSEVRLQEGEKDTWIQCDKCKTWFHWRCIGQGDDYEALHKWYCQPCRDANPTLKSTLKPPARKSSRKRTQLDYANLHAGLDPSTHDANKWLHIIATKDIKSADFRRMEGSDVNMEWLERDPDALKEPVIIENPEGLGMRMPSEEFTVADVAECIGPETPLEVIDVSTQSTSPNWTLGKWVEYYSLPASSRDKIRNVISLEFSNTPLVNKVHPPRIVKELDWVELFWPASKRGPGHAYPKVQMYCLMSVSNAWTDWHIDFAGSSVYYHIFKGSKVFYFIRPTPSNLSAYERWSGTDMQTTTWLGDMVDEVFKVELVEGSTMIIPTGWIHAVYTPVDSLVFGGNFLHSWNVATQLRVRDIEIATHVPKKFRFPLFSRLCWYVGERYLRDLKAYEEFSTRILESLAALADFLVSEARLIESRPSSLSAFEVMRKEAKDAIPADKVKDGPGLARELRWRVRNALGLTSDDETMSKKSKPYSVTAPARRIKRKRESVDLADHSEREEATHTHLFRNWAPLGWDKETCFPRQTRSEIRQLQGAIFKENDTGLEDWNVDITDGNEMPNGTAKDEVSVETTLDVIVKVRQMQSGTEDIIERQRVERKLEVFKRLKKEYPECISGENGQMDMNTNSLSRESKIESCVS